MANGCKSVLPVDIFTILKKIFINLSEINFIPILSVGTAIRRPQVTFTLKLADDQWSSLHLDILHLLVNGGYHPPTDQQNTNPYGVCGFCVC